jgi:RNA polymerase sigma-70 factor (ECF subfamily)
MEVTAIYKEFHKELLGYVRSKIRSKEDAEDILQNVFIRIASNVDKLAAEVKLKNWIFTITRNAIIDYYRASANKKKVALGEDADERIFETEDADPTRGLDQCMNSMISLLPEEYRDIITESEIKGIKQKDLAEKYGIAYPSLRSRVQRGRERLKQLFYNCCNIETDTRGNVMSVQGKTGCERPCNPCSVGNN